MMMYLNIIVIGLLVAQDLLLLLIGEYRFVDHAKGKKISEWPKVTVLVPARNEEEHLPACLESLERIKYPQERLQIIVGDDHSTDNTSSIIKEWVSKGNNRLFIPVVSSDSRKVNGKANALGQMAKMAEGEFLLFTDADCEVGAFWIMELVSAYHSRQGLITGITTVRTGSFFSTMQSIDWWLTLGMVKTTSDLSYAVTAMGNNMLVEKQAYLEVGGFDAIPFSVTEDLALAEVLIGRGYRPAHQVSAGSLVVTKSEQSIWELLKQRKRWMNGALSLPWYWILLLSLQHGFFPAMVYLLLANPLWGLPVWLLKVLLQSLFIKNFAGRSGLKVSWFHLSCFEFYYVLVSWSTIVYYFWPSSINWKERHYQ